MTKDNGRPVIKASELGFAALSLHPGESPTLVCPDCGRWSFWKRGMIKPHNSAADERCSGSNQRLDLDVSTGDWLRSLPEQKVAAMLAARRAERLSMPHTARSSMPPPALSR
jgi:hypothetical protein